GAQQHKPAGCSYGAGKKHAFGAGPQAVHSRAGSASGAIAETSAVTVINKQEKPAGTMQPVFSCSLHGLLAGILPAMTLSVCIITYNEEANIRRTLESVKNIADEIVVVDSRSTDNTVALAQSLGAKV